jgi:predicted PurR-regulated permease PerM
LQRTTAALDYAGSRLSRYLLAQTALNTTFGIVIGGGLALIGIPNPVLWGILAGVLRFVPYIGAFFAAAFPLAFAVAVDPGWSMVIVTAALFLLVETILGQVVEPMLYRPPDQRFPGGRDRSRDVFGRGYGGPSVCYFPRRSRLV